ESVTSQELEYLIELGARQGSIDKVREELLSSVLAFTEVLVKEIMIPRTQVVALEETATYEEALKLVTESELSRIPVYRGSLDEVVGVLHAKTLLADVKKGIEPAEFQLVKYLKKPFFVPEVMKVSRLLTETLGGFLTATAGRVPPPGSLVVWGGLTFTVKAADDRRVQKVEITRKPTAGAAVTGPQHSMPEKTPAALQAPVPPDKVH